MKIYHNEINGDGTAPEFERETNFFIPLDVFLLEIEECSYETNVTLLSMVDYIKGGGN